MVRSDSTAWSTRSRTRWRWKRRQVREMRLGDRRRTPSATMAWSPPHELATTVILHDRLRAARGTARAGTRSASGSVTSRSEAWRSSTDPKAAWLRPSAYEFGHGEPEKRGARPVCVSTSVFDPRRSARGPNCDRLWVPFPGPTFGLPLPPPRPFVTQLGSHHALNADGCRRPATGRLQNEKPHHRFVRGGVRVEKIDEQSVSVLRVPAWRRLQPLRGARRQSGS